MDRLRRRSFSIAAVFVTAGLCLGPGRVPAGAEETGVSAPAALSDLVVETASGRHAFKVEIAATPAERSRGLMYRKSLPADQGMLFDMEVAGPAAFWMANTYVSLDIIFIGSDGRVLNVARRTTPLSRDTVASEGDARFVLELLAGQADAIGLGPGDRIRHPLIEAAGRS